MTKKKWGKYMKSRVLLIGPDVKRSKGGMATVIHEIATNTELNQKFDISVHASYIDGSHIVRLLYSVYAFLKFCLIYRTYDMFHIHMASYGSTYRKGCYVRFLKRHGKKVILHIHGASFLVFYDALNEKRKRYVSEILNSADTVIALSEQWKQEFEKRFELDNCVSIHNGIQVKNFECARSDVEKFSNSFLFLGRLGERKGTYDLLAAAELLRENRINITCYLAGDGKIEEFKKLVKEKKLDEYIKVIGWVNANDKVRLLKKTATVVLPSYHEGLPMAILEGMAAGKAIISTNVGAIPEVVENGVNGFIIEPGDVKGLANAMRRCMEDIETLKKISQNNRRKSCDSFGCDRMCEKIAEIFYK